MHGIGKYTFKNGKEYKGTFNMGRKMNDRIEMYRAWKSMNYGVDPNQVNHEKDQNQNIALNDNINVNMTNNGQNNIEDNLRN